MAFEKSIVRRRLFPYVLVFALVMMHVSAPAAVIKIAWDPNSESDLAGYKVYYGTASGSYGTPINAGNVTTFTITGLALGQTYFVAVTAYDTSNNESGFSNEVNGPAQDPATALPLFLQTAAPFVDIPLYLVTADPVTFQWDALASPPDRYELQLTCIDTNQVYGPFPSTTTSLAVRRPRTGHFVVSLRYVLGGIPSAWRDSTDPGNKVYVNGSLLRMGGWMLYWRMPAPGEGQIE